MPSKLLVVFVHGWSVTNTETYGGLPIRLRDEANALGIDIHVEEIFIGRYISFHDEVRVSDISRAFQTAVEEQLSSFAASGIRFACIAHSTGGPVIRDWWHRYYVAKPIKPCPMSHLIMLAPANFGSTLAQIGKGRIYRLNSWFEGVEPGQGVLDWLELGSHESWQLNTAWILGDGSQIDADGVFPFVLTGQSINRAFYDNLNTYTGELGSDGVVRVAAANICSTYIEMEQESPYWLPSKSGKTGKLAADKLIFKTFKRSPRAALRIISGKSHSSKEMGIIRSIKESRADAGSRETVGSILACLRVKTKSEFEQLCDRFQTETKAVQQQELVEVEEKLFRSPEYFFHDKFSMVIFRVCDDEGHPVPDYDLILTAGKDADPNHLPRGFFADRQRNHLNPETLTYYFNYDVMNGTDEVKDSKGNIVRNAIAGADMLGFQILARPDKGFVHYLPCEFHASKEMLEKALTANATTLVNIRLRRVVRKNVFVVDKPTPKPIDFKDTKPSEPILK